MKQPLDLTVMMYHYVRDPGDSAEAGSGISGMSVRDFEAHWMISRGSIHLSAGRFARVFTGA